MCARALSMKATDANERMPSDDISLIEHYSLSLHWYTTSRDDGVKLAGTVHNVESLSYPALPSFANCPTQNGRGVAFVCGHTFVCRSLHVASVAFHSEVDDQRITCQIAARKDLFQLLYRSIFGLSASDQTPAAVSNSGELVSTVLPAILALIQI